MLEPGEGWLPHLCPLPGVPKCEYRSVPVGVRVGRGWLSAFPLEILPPPHMAKQTVNPLAAGMWGSRETSVGELHTLVNVQGDL